MFWIAKDKLGGKRQYYWIYRAAPGMKDQNVLTECPSFPEAKKAIIKMLRADIRESNGDIENLTWQISHFKAQPITDIISYTND